ncbi:phosphotransferase family protein [Novosphingobium bradum]|uniref:Phosphotransferase family protein n=1 Tax=Novosphingobium bradum TaxID=1737444 RepID=A0ABV7IS76_9SPHN
MPIAKQREMKGFRQTMEAWLRERLPDARDLAIDTAETPRAVGNSNETIMFGATWQEDGRACSGDYVIRIAPSDFQVMMNPQFRESMLVQRALGESGLVPTPKVLWDEADPEVLGAPFFVMERLRGRVPTDNPSYNDPESWVGRLSPAERETLWTSAFQTFCAIHRQDLYTMLDLPLPPPAPGSSGLEQALAYSDRFIVWAGDGQVHPVALATRDWLHANLPAHRPTGFGWGDPRIENMMFGDDLRCIAVMDLELANLAGPQADLGWWLFMDTQATLTGNRHPRLEGLGDRARTLELWREWTGRPVDDLEWYEVFAGYRNIACSTRFAILCRQFGRALPSTVSALDNSSLRTTAQMLGLKPPASYDALVTVG